MAARLTQLAYWFRDVIETLAGLSGKAATGTATFVFLCLAAFSTFKHGDITDNVLYGFITILGGYTAHTTITQYREKKDGKDAKGSKQDSSEG